MITRESPLLARRGDRWSIPALAWDSGIPTRTAGLESSRHPMTTLLLALFLFTQIAQGGVITGRILAEDGSPVGNKRIAAQAVLDRGDVDLGASMLAGISQTGNDGRFRLANIPPGRYYIVLDPLDLPSYYPGVTKQERATIVSVAEGAMLADLDFKMPDFDGGKISGRLAPPTIPPTGPVRVVLFPNDQTGVTPTLLAASINSASL